MDARLIKLKGDFNNVITIRNSIKSIFDTLQIRIEQLKAYYNEFIKTNTQTIFIFGLDSFRFQNKLIDIEYNDMRRLFLAISNRMYCEYFKLYKIVVDYITKNVKDAKLIEMTKLNHFPVYKDLEPYREYKFETVQEIHENILTLIGSLISVWINKENDLDIYKAKREIGLNIDNFITSYNFSNIVMREEISTFLTYVEFFHKLHTKYLKRFSNKIQLMYMHINTDIRFDETMYIEHMPMHSSYVEDITSDSDKVMLDIKKSISPVNPYRSPSGSVAPGSVAPSSVGHGSVAPSSVGSGVRTGIKTDHKFSNNELRTLFTEINMSCDNILLHNMGYKEDIGLSLDTARDDLDEESIHNKADTLRLDEIREPHSIKLILEHVPYQGISPIKSSIEEHVHTDLESIQEEPPLLPEDVPVLTEDPPLLPEDAPLLPEDPPLLPEDAPLLPEDAPVLTEDPPLLPEDAPVLTEDPPLLPEDAPIVDPPPKKKRTYNRSKSKAAPTI